MAEEIASIGDLLFILIGTVKGLRPSVQEVQSSTVKELRLVPSLAGPDVQRIDTGIYAIRNILPIEELLARIAQDLGQQGGVSAEDRRGVAKAYDELHVLLSLT